MNLLEQIKTVEKINERISVVNKSNFIAQLYPTASENESKKFISESKKKYYNASHHCFAYKLSNGESRYSDAGEPKGTAGIRILNAIDHFELNNQLIVVSRIFGGIKLGVGPLGKAYYDAAFSVIESSTIKIKHLFRKGIIVSSFDKVNLIHRILSDYKSEVLETKYNQLVEFICLLKSSEIDSISKKITDSGKGMISITIQDEIVYK